MKLLHYNKRVLKSTNLLPEHYFVLDYEQLLKVNGMSSSSSSSTSVSSNSENLTSKGYPSSRDPNYGTSASGSLSERGYPSSTAGYNPSAPVKDQNIKIYAWDKDRDGKVDHFVNDIGNGQYFDPANGKTGYVSDLDLATAVPLGGTRELIYQK